MIKRSLEIGYSIAIAMTCVYNFVNAATSVCLLVKCDDAVATTMKTMFPRTLAFVCFVSRIVLVYKSIKDFPKYNKKIEEYELHFPVNVSKRQRLVFFTVTIVIVYTLMILPINVFRIYLIHYYSSDSNELLLFYIMMYIQSMSICSVEIHFMVRCFGLYQQFQSINEEMAALKLETINACGYPTVLQSEEIGGSACGDGPRPSNDNMYFSRANAHGLANVVELLRTRHQFVRAAFVDLNNLYSLQVGMSIFLLFILVLFDIYGEVFMENKKTRSQIMIYGWLLQYFFRFFSIIMTTHFTTKQASKTKTFITDINNQYLDNGTKEELHMFFNQLFHKPVEFTSCELFTMDAHLITTVIATGTTYLVVLLQIN